MLNTKKRKKNNIINKEYNSEVNTIVNNYVDSYDYFIKEKRNISREEEEEIEMRREIYSESINLHRDWN